MKEIKPLQHSLTKQKHRKNYKTADLNNVSNLKLGTKLKDVNFNSNRKFKDGEGEVTCNRDIDRSITVSNDNSRLLVHERDSSVPKKSRRKYKNRSRTVLKHSTNLKPSKNRPILKSCVLIKHDKYTEENKFLSGTPRMSLSKLDGNFIFFETKCLI